jgi:hypothetical protein
MQINTAKELVFLLGWDYDRLSSSGQETYNKLCEVMGVAPFDDEDFGDDKRFDDAEGVAYDEEDNK